MRVRRAVWVLCRVVCWVCRVRSDRSLFVGVAAAVVGLCRCRAVRGAIESRRAKAKSTYTRRRTRNGPSDDGWFLARGWVFHSRGDPPDKEIDVGVSDGNGNDDNDNVDTTTNQDGVGKSSNILFSMGSSFGVRVSSHYQWVSISEHEEGDRSGSAGVVCPGAGMLVGTVWGGRPVGRCRHCNWWRSVVGSMTTGTRPSGTIWPPIKHRHPEIQINMRAGEDEDEDEMNRRNSTRKSPNVQTTSMVQVGDVTQWQVDTLLWYLKKKMK